MGCDNWENIRLDLIMWENKKKFNQIICCDKMMMGPREMSFRKVTWGSRTSFNENNNIHRSL